MSCSCKIGGGPDGVCFECRRAANFNKRLKKLESSHEDAIAEGRRLATAEIVADMRACSKAVRNVACVRPVNVGDYVEALADRYERGEHKEGR